MGIFEMWLNEIENIGYYTKINKKKITRAFVNALMLYKLLILCFWPLDSILL